MAYIFFLPGLPPQNASTVSLGDQPALSVVYCTRATPLVTRIEAKTGLQHTMPPQVSASAMRASRAPASCCCAMHVLSVANVNHPRYAGPGSFSAWACNSQP